MSWYARSHAPSLFMAFPSPPKVARRTPCRAKIKVDVKTSEDILKPYEIIFNIGPVVDNKEPGRRYFLKVNFMKPVSCS